MASSSSGVGNRVNTTSNDCDAEDDCQILQNSIVVSNTDVDEIVQSQTKKAKTLTSNVWNYFVKIRVSKDGKEKCKCRACGKEYSCASILGTSHLSRHIPKCHMIPHFHDVGELLIDCEGKLRKRKIDSKMNREILSELIIAHDLPFRVVKWRVFRKYQKKLNEDCRSISRRIAKYVVMKKYEIEKENVKQQLAQIPGRVCLTSNCWTACTNIGFISLTVHSVDND